MSACQPADTPVEEGLKLCVRFLLIKGDIRGSLED